jgi:succinate dehydrogenase/fumarate reductase flavoprotein subunit
MAGLAAAAHAAQEGASVLVLEKGDRPGGSMLLSSGVVWRYREFQRFRAECPGGDPVLQRTIHERLEDDLRWLRSLGAPVLERETGNPATEGWRFEPAGLAATLARYPQEVRLSEPLRSIPDDAPVILATGGFQANKELVRRFITPHADALVLRAAPWSTGDGLMLGLEAGGRSSAGMHEFYGRNMPASTGRIAEQDFIGLAQLYARHAAVQNARGERYRVRTWSEVDVVQWTAKQPGARAWYSVPDSALGERVRDQTVSEMIEAARQAGAPVQRQNGVTTVEVVAGITTTLGGLKVGLDCRVADSVFACGGDVGSISTGGYSSGLAAALVLGRLAAEQALFG